MLSIFRAAFFALVFFHPSVATADLPRPLDKRHTLRMVTEALEDRGAGMTVEYSLAGAVFRNAKGVNIPSDFSDLHDAMRAETNGQRREKLVAEFVSALASSPQNEAKPEITSNRADGELPFLRGGEARRQFFASGPSLALSPDVIVTWSFDVTRTRSDGQSQTNRWNVTSNLLRALGLDKKDIASAALVNLAKQQEGVSPRQIDGTRISMVRGENVSALLLLNSFWESRVGPAQRLVAAVPKRGLILWIVDPDPAELAALRERAQNLQAYELKILPTSAALRAADPAALAFQVVLTMPVGGDDPITSDLFLRTGPQLWHDPGWQVLAREDLAE